MFRRLGLQVRRYQGAERFSFDTDAALVQVVGSGARLILDVGANVGQSALWFRQLFPQATIHSFEPFPDSFTKLVAAVGDRPNHCLHPLAAAETSQRLQLHANADATTNSLLASTRAGEKMVPSLVGRDRVPVEAIRLDDFCQQHHITNIDLLKLDIQGGEAMALRGATGLLKRGEIRVVFTEVLFADLYQGQAEFGEIAELLRGFGFRLFSLSNVAYADDGAMAWGDAIFRRSN